ncbi:NYN domain-containing protein [Candidatus Dojkabacteria bacterium]|nr:NYN domain-containing protein [Candidatus Dojkabacteria bacterium]
MDNYAFIDSQNLYLGIMSTGWKIDYPRFRLYLKNKYNVSMAFMFIGQLPNNQKLYTTLQLAGFILVFKPTVRYFADKREAVKGNVDAELVLHAAAIEYNNYKKAVIVSGDGDFSCLIQYLKEKGKLLKVLTPNHKYSCLPRKYDTYIIRLDKQVGSFGYKKKKPGLAVGRNLRHPWL